MSPVPRLFSWAILARFLVLLLFVLPTPADESSGGGDGGIINLPGGRDRNGFQGYRMRVVREDLRNGVVLRMPADMHNAMAILSHAGATVPFLIDDGYLTLSGQTLVSLRASRVTTFKIDIFGQSEQSISMTVDLDANSWAFTITVW